MIFKRIEIDGPFGYVSAIHMWDGHHMLHIWILLSRSKGYVLEVSMGYQHLSSASF